MAPAEGQRAQRWGFLGSPFLAFLLAMGSIRSSWEQLRLGPDPDMLHTMSELEPRSCVQEGKLWGLEKDKIPASSAAATTYTPHALS